MSDDWNDDDLHAFADGRLEGDRAARVAARLEGDASARARIAAYRRQNEALRAAYAPVLDEPVPARLKAVAAPRRRRPWPAVAAALAGLVVGATLGWLARDAGGDGAAGEVARRAALAYVVYAADARHPVEVYADQSDQLARWLGGRMGAGFRVPSLDGLGFRLIGGRLMMGSRGPAALLMYEDKGERRLAVYIRNDLAADGKSAIRYRLEDGVGVAFWVDRENGVGVSGKLGERLLTAVASRVRTELQT